MDAQLKKGVLEVCVLAALSKEESYGYKIISDVSPYIEISESTLYPILKRLVACGYVTVRSAMHNGRTRKYYMITASGRDKIRGFISEFGELVQVYEFICRGGN